MTAEIVKLDPVFPDNAFSRCRNVIKNGGVIVYPTETFYGLGVDPLNAEAVERIFSLKGRGAAQPLLVLLADAAHVTDWAIEVSADAERLMQQYWPGPLTLVFKAQSSVPVALTGGTGSIGLRVPGNPVTRRLLQFIGTGLTGTSANVSGQASAMTAEQAAAVLGDKVDLILDAGPAQGGKPSTVMDVRALPFKVIRPGRIDL